jgi:hypothetical protein
LGTAFAILLHLPNKLSFVAFIEPCIQNWQEKKILENDQEKD